MSDQLYLSLWFPNFRVAALPQALTSVLRQFAVIAKNGSAGSTLGQVQAASVYPIDWTESPTYQRVYGHLNDPVERSAGSTTPEADAALIEAAVADAAEAASGGEHDDLCFEFEMRWTLWQPASTTDASWQLSPARVRIMGFGPDFDANSYEQNGHIRIDFGQDTAWVFDDQHIDQQYGAEAATFIQQNVEKLLAVTLLIEKHCNISSRLLWTESGEPLAEKLIARLQRLN